MASKQNEAIIERLKAMGLDTAALEAGDLPTVESLMEHQDGSPFDFVGENYDPALGRYIQVFADQDVKSMQAQGYQIIKNGVTTKGIPGGHIMLRPKPLNDVYAAARKRREQAELASTVSAPETDQIGPAHLMRQVRTERVR